MWPFTLTSTPFVRVTAERGRVPSSHFPTKWKGRILFWIRKDQRSGATFQHPKPCVLFCFWPFSSDPAAPSCLLIKPGLVHMRFFCQHWTLGGSNTHFFINFPANLCLIYKAFLMTLFKNIQKEHYSALCKTTCFTFIGCLLFVTFLPSATYSNLIFTSAKNLLSKSQRKKRSKL